MSVRWMYLRAWHEMNGHTEEAIQNQMCLAMDEGAATDAVFRRIVRERRKIGGKQQYIACSYWVLYRDMSETEKFLIDDHISKRKLAGDWRYAER